MSMLLHFFSLLSAAFYLTAIISYLCLLSPRFKNLVILPRALLFVGASLHATFLILILLRPIPDNNIFLPTSYPYVLSVLSLSLITLFLFLERRFKLSLLGVVLAPIGAGIMCFSAFIFHTSLDVQSDTTQDFLLLFHIFFIIAAEVLFIFAFGISVTIIFMENSFKRRLLPIFGTQMPPLVILDRLNRLVLSLGVFSMSLGFSSGFSSMFKEKELFLLADTRVLWPLISLFIYGGLVLAMWFYGLRGRRAAWMSVLGFCSVIASFISGGFGGTFHVQ